MICMKNHIVELVFNCYIIMKRKSELINFSRGFAV